MSNSNDNIIPLHAPPLSVEEVLDDIASQEFDDVLVIGRHDDGNFYFNSTILDKANVNYILDLVKLDLLTQ